LWNEVPETAGRLQGPEAVPDADAAARNRQKRNPRTETAETSAQPTRKAKTKRKKEIVGS
jgi:hypothetical protein